MYIVGILASLHISDDPDVIHRAIKKNNTKKYIWLRGEKDAKKCRYHAHRRKTKTRARRRVRQFKSVKMK